MLKMIIEARVDQDAEVGKESERDGACRHVTEENEVEGGAAATVRAENARNNSQEGPKGPDSSLDSSLWEYD